MLPERRKRDLFIKIVFRNLHNKIYHYMTRNEKVSIIGSILYSQIFVAHLFLSIQYLTVWPFFNFCFPKPTSITAWFGDPRLQDLSSKILDIDNRNFNY